MKSPFPGMDPYIEERGLWPDFHDDLINEIKRAIAAALPPRYFVRTDVRSYVVHFRENFIEIFDAELEERLVTCLEMLSPSNKRRGTEGWDLYLKKRNALLLGSANFLEIDLLRGGQRMPMIDPWPASPYYVLFCRKRRAPSCTVLRADYRRPLPHLIIPLADSDPDVKVALQPMVEAVYERSRYYLRIDYSKPLGPPLSAEDGAWVVERVRAWKENAGQATNG